MFVANLVTADGGIWIAIVARILIIKLRRFLHAGIYERLHGFISDEKGGYLSIPVRLE